MIIIYNNYYVHMHIIIYTYACVIYITAIAIDLRLCNSNGNQLQQAPAEVTLCLLYDYQNLITFVTEVCNNYCTVIGLVNNQ